MGVNKLPFLVALSLYLLISSGCASAVRTKYSLPSVADGQPYAVITEKGMKSGYISAEITGFLTSKTNYENYEMPEDIESSTKKALKLAYMVTPYGWATLGIHRKKGCIIRVPAERIGVCISYRYYNELSRKTLFFYEDSVHYWIKYEGDTWEETKWITLNEDEKYTLNLTEMVTPPREIKEKTEEFINRYDSMIRYEGYIKDH